VTAVYIAHLDDRKDGTDSSLGGCRHLASPFYRSRMADSRRYEHIQLARCRPALRPQEDFEPPAREALRRGRESSWTGVAYHNLPIQHPVVRRGRRAGRNSTRATGTWPRITAPRRRAADTTRRSAFAPSFGVDVSTSDGSTICTRSRPAARPATGTTPSGGRAMHEVPSAFFWLNRRRRRLPDDAISPACRARKIRKSSRQRARPPPWTRTGQPSHQAALRKIRAVHRRGTRTGSYRGSRSTSGSPPSSWNPSTPVDELHLAHNFALPPPLGKAVGLRASLAGGHRASVLSDSAWPAWSWKTMTTRGRDPLAAARSGSAPRRGTLAMLIYTLRGHQNFL